MNPLPKSKKMRIATACLVATVLLLLPLGGCFVSQVEVPAHLPLECYGTYGGCAFNGDFFARSAIVDDKVHAGDTVCFTGKIDRVYVYFISTESFATVQGKSVTLASLAGYPPSFGRSCILDEITGPACYVFTNGKMINVALMSPMFYRDAQEVNVNIYHKW